MNESHTSQQNDNFVSFPQVLTSSGSYESELEPLLSPTLDAGSLVNYRSISTGIDDGSIFGIWKFKSLYACTLLLFFIIGIISLFVYDLKYCIQNVAFVTNIDMKAASVNLNSSIPLLNVSTAFTFDYSKANATSVKFGFLGLGWLIGSIHFDIGNITELYISDDSSSSIHLANVVIPKGQREFEINIQEGKKNEICFTNVQVKLDYDTLPNYINDVFEKREFPAHTFLHVSTRIDSTFYHKHAIKFGYPISAFNLTKIITQFENSINVSDISLGTDDSGSPLFGTAILNLPKSKELSFLSFKGIPKLPWKAGLKFNSNFSGTSSLISAETYPIEYLSLNESHKVNVSYKISLKNKLLKRYQGQFNDLTPINYYVNKLLEDKFVPLYISGALSENLQIIDWLSKFLTALNLKFFVTSGQFFFSKIKENPVKDVSIKKVLFGPDNGDLILSLDPIISLDDDFARFNFNIPRIRGNSDVDSDCDLLCQFRLPSWCNSSYSLVDSTFMMSLDELSLHINEAENLGKTLKRFFNGENLQFEVRNNIDFELSMPTFSTVFREVPIINAVRIPGNFANVTDMFNMFEVSLNQVTFVDSSHETLSLNLDLNLKTEDNFTIENNFEWLEFQILYLKSVISKIGVRKFSLNDGSDETTNLRLSMNLKSDSEVGKMRIEEFVGKYISGISPQVEIQGIPDKASPESESLSKLLESLKLTLSVPQISRGKASPKSPILSEVDRQSLFIVDSTIHIVSSEIELTVYNPVQNHAIAIVILNAKASHDGTTLGFVSQEEGFIVPPGLYKTPRISVTIVRSGLGADILRDALNGELDIDTQAILDVKLGDFGMTLLYRGSGVKTKIRL
ncbi:DEBR0S1_00474g1_1 [Brettanomyces bruxellensis]|uniref:DEBR0S1_00474g1_1 n=1 Tax=Dekkera bruxellensis TaxID=5007 RepID=A0A7D9GWY0_DEKBR|nr:DEBR0S1_00474g1_1 [Brettanomyces bruxellensis]